MNFWMCSDCEYIYEVDMSEEGCPECDGQCDFYSIMRYISECGGGRSY